MTDIDLIAKVYERLTSLEREEGPESLSSARSVVSFAWGGYGMVGWGGLSYFHETIDETAGEIEQVVGAFRTLGIEDVANAFTESTGVFHEVCSKSDGKQR